MKKLILIALAVLLGCSVLAQSPGGTTYLTLDANTHGTTTSGPGFAMSISDDGDRTGEVRQVDLHIVAHGLLC